MQIKIQSFFYDIIHHLRQSFQERGELNKHLARRQKEKLFFK